MPQALNVLYDDPAWMKEYEQTDSLKRLRKVEMNCGVSETSLPLFKTLPAYSRYWHSIHTADLAWHFTKDKIQTLACLYHDIATPAFAHTVDFMQGDYIAQESTEKDTFSMMAGDTGLLNLLKRDGIRLDQISNYHRYPIADNDSPKVSCDRLEYTLGNACNYRFAGIGELRGIIDDMVPAEEELVFHSMDKAHKLGMLSLQCGRVYASDGDRYAMEILSRLLKDAVKDKILTLSDLYSDEEQVIRKLEQSSLKEKWRKYQSLSDVKRYTEPVKDSIRIHTKKRYMNPLVKGKGRLAAIDEEYAEMLKEFREESQDVWLKGVFDEDNCSGKYE